MKQETEDQPTEVQEPWLKRRYVITIVGFFLFVFMNAYRMNASVALVAMVNKSALIDLSKPSSNSCSLHLLNTTSGFPYTENKLSLELGEFDWSPKMQGYFLSSYFIGCTLVQIPAGKLVERYGGKWLLFWGAISAAIATMMIPMASRFHIYAAISMQFIRGIGQGFFQPSAVLLAANWFPKLERGFCYTFMMSGFSIGACLGSIFAGILCKSNLLGGWPSSFYAFGIAGFILSIVIAVFIHESPGVHPNISETELKYITSNQENTLAKRRPNAPWGKILRSGPVYGLTLGNFGQIWGISQFMTVHSTFLGTIMHYPIRENGFLSAAPFLTMFLFTQFSSSLSTFMITRKYASVNQTRKFWNFLATVGFSACLLGLYFAGCDRPWSIGLSILSMGFRGFGMSGISNVAPEMSPTFAATLNSICTTIGCIPFFLLPIIVGSLTNEMQTIEQWNKVFFISIGVIMASGMIFQVFGSAKIQPWNTVEDSSKQVQVQNTKF